uniref:Glutaredoxin domain-containing protein n=1 Tax=Sinocyclocheilus anshuiensis TaxID=1608454 RepID=A0A671N7S1_9TELE
MFTRGCFYESKQAYQTLRMGNFTSSAPGLSGSACTQFVQVSWFVLVHSEPKMKVPRVFINGQCVGGGKLLPLIEQCRPCCLSTSPEGSGSAQ